jgi:hypothetical protein
MQPKSGKVMVHGLHMTMKLFSNAMNVIQYATAVASHTGQR